MIQALGLHLGITAGVMILAGIGLTYLISYEYTGAKSFEAMRHAGQPVAVEIKKSPTPLSEQDRGRPRLDIIRERGSIRVGYYSDTLPFAFRNDQGQVVGFDMEMLHELARDLDIRIELSHLKDAGQEPQMLSDGRLDITVGGRTITPERALDVAFSDSYTRHTVGFMVADSRRDKFSTIDKIATIDDLHIGMPDIAYYKKRIQEMFPNATLTTVESPRKYFKGEYPDVDVFIYSAEAGSAWAMLYPGYTSVVAKGVKIIAPIGFALPKSQLDFTRFINTWLQLKKDNAYQQQVYDYWILGKNPKAKKPRWSVIRNVFGWDI